MEKSEYAKFHVEIILLHFLYYKNKHFGLVIKIY